MEFGVLGILGIWSLWFRNFGGLGFWSFGVPAVASDAPPVAAEQAPADVVHSQGQEAVSVASGVSPVPDSLAPAAAVATAADQFIILMALQLSLLFQLHVLFLLLQQQHLIVL